MNIIVIYGGQSVEHDVSILTGLHAAKHLPRSAKIRLVYMARDGQMLASGRRGVLSKIDYYLAKVGKPAPCWFTNKTLCTRWGFLTRRFVVDSVVNCCHGGPGEDGRLAAFFDVLGIPVTSCGPEAALAFQSKSRTREILTKSDFAQPTYQVLKGKGVANVPFDAFPVIVKPDTLGSSIGITVANNQDELDSAIEFAFTMDDTVIVEQFIKSATEVNCAVFRCGGKTITSACEVITKQGDMFSFDTKYLDSGSGFIKSPRGKKTATPKQRYKYEDEIKTLAARAYDLFGARGVVRADFLVADDKIYLNEANTIPGFLAYHLWKGIGLEYTTLLQMMTEQSISASKKTLETGFSSDILQKNRILVE
ncbi:MAG: hypothetical protein LBG88_04670 [Christensenellaceae bacterium]|jgi:D-alanine-D-alanine ligase|nr:hypothetical protein [Christensenellaceae bacterium]